MEEAHPREQLLANCRGVVDVPRKEERVELCLRELTTLPLVRRILVITAAFGARAKLLLRIASVVRAGER